MTITRTPDPRCSGKTTSCKPWQWAAASKWHCCNPVLAKSDVVYKGSLGSVSSDFIFAGFNQGSHNSVLCTDW